MIICENCGRENEDEYKFCLGCGSALPEPTPEVEESSEPEMIDCPHCGTTVPSNFKFCGACGGPIEERSQEPAASEPAGAAARQASQPAPAGAGQPAAEQVAAPSGGRQAQTDRSTDPTGKPQPSAEQHADASQPASASQQAAESRKAPQRQQPRTVARLVVIRPDGSEGADISLRRGEQTVGRDSASKALANDPFLSPEHATFVCTQDALFVRDEGSLNGVFVRVDESVELRHHDQIRVGQELLRYEELADSEPVVERTEEETKIAGSDPEGLWGRLCLMAGPDLVSRAFALGEEAVTIGRESGDILFRDDGFVSGTHARIRRDGDTPILEDLNSSNGTYRRIRQETRLDDGALLLMGQQLFRLSRV